MANKPAPAQAGDLLDLVAPGGCDEANHGGVRYRVDNDGHVHVPRDAAFWLIHRGGFKPAPDPDPGPAPIEEMTAPKKDGDGAEESKPIPAKAPKVPVPTKE
jgi:hypothetical protein